MKKVFFICCYEKCRLGSRTQQGRAEFDHHRTQKHKRETARSKYHPTEERRRICEKMQMLLTIKPWIHFPCSLFYPLSFKLLLLTCFCFFANKQHRSTLDYHQIHKHLCDLLLLGNRGHNHIQHRRVHLIRLWINIQITNLHRLAKHQLRQVALNRWGDLITERLHADVLQRCVQ